jgi:Zn ribbon nucleic-acid-binding protein
VLESVPFHVFCVPAKLLLIVKNYNIQVRECIECGMSDFVEIGLEDKRDRHAHRQTDRHTHTHSIMMLLAYIIPLRNGNTRCAVK